jgi:gas vesicle protein
VDETWKQISDIIKGGFSVDTAQKIRKVVEEKVQQVQKLGDEAWQKGMEQAKPLLEKNPKIKELVEQNADALKKGNAGELFDKVKSSIESGDTGDLEKYVKDAAGKAKESVGEGGFEEYLGKIPGADQILPKLSKLQEVAQEHGEEAEKLLKSTMDDITKILSKRSDEAKELAEKAKKDT